VDPQETVERMEPLDLLVCVVLTVCPGPLVPQDQWDLPDPQESPESPDLRERLALLE